MINKDMTQNAPNDSSKERKVEDEMKQPNENSGVFVQGHIKIFDPETKEVFIDKRNAIHHENLSYAIALSLANKTNGFISTMHFGNGGTSVDPTGVITYLPPLTNTQNSDLYNPTYSKMIDDTNATNTDPLRNKMEIRHIPGTVYTDILVTCLLDYGEPSGALAFDNAANLDSDYVFDELGLKTEDGLLLTHVIFHPIQKSTNRLIQIDYTVRIQTLTNLSSIL